MLQKGQKDRSCWLTPFSLEASIQRAGGGGTQLGTGSASAEWVRLVSEVNSTGLGPALGTGLCPCYRIGERGWVFD